MVPILLEPEMILRKFKVFSVKTQKEIQSKITSIAVELNGLLFHFGGLWEAAIKSMKRHLRRCVGTQILTHDELNTLVIQIEGNLNSRPLTAMSANPNDFQLTSYWDEG